MKINGRLYTINLKTKENGFYCDFSLQFLTLNGFFFSTRLSKFGEIVKENMK